MPYAYLPSLFDDFSLSFTALQEHSSVWRVCHTKKSCQTPGYPRRLRNHWVSTIHQGNSIGVPAWSLPRELGPNHPMSQWVPIKWWEEYADQCGFNLSSRCEFQLKRTKYVKTIKLNVGKAIIIFRKAVLFVAFVGKITLLQNVSNFSPHPPGVWGQALALHIQSTPVSFWNPNRQSIWLLSTSKWSFTQQLLFINKSEWWTNTRGIITYCNLLVAKDPQSQMMQNRLAYYLDVSVAHWVWFFSPSWRVNLFLQKSMVVVFSGKRILFSCFSTSESQFWDKSWPVCGTNWSWTAPPACCSWYVACPGRSIPKTKLDAWIRLHFGEKSWEKMTSIFSLKRFWNADRFAWAFFKIVVCGKLW